jgi:DNA-binding IclR family transcriptional regulator
MKQQNSKRGSPGSTPTDEDLPQQAEEVGVAAVNRALAILDSFSEEAAALTLAQISKKTGLYKSTILRLLQSLEAFDYVRRLDSGLYVLGPTPVRLGTLAKKGFHPAEVLMPVLRDLVQATSESASFYVRSGNMRLCAYRIDSPRSVRDNVQIGQLIPLNKGAGGHVLLDFENFSRAELENGVKRLVHVTRGERDSETAAIACPVFGPEMKLEGALSISGPIHRFDDQAVAKMTPHLIDAARSLTDSFFGDVDLFRSAH